MIVQFLLLILEMFNLMFLRMKLFYSSRIKCLHMFLFSSKQDHLTIVRSCIFVRVHELLLE